MFENFKGGTTSHAKNNPKINVSKNSDKKLDFSEGPAKDKKPKILAKTSAKNAAKKENNLEVGKITSFFDKICQKTAKIHPKNAATNRNPAMKSCDQICPEQAEIRSSDVMTRPSNPYSQTLAQKFPSD